VERERFLSRVRAASRGAVFPAATGPTAAPVIEIENAIERFVAEAEAAAATVTRVPDALAVVDAVAGVMAGSDRLLAWDDLGAIVPGWATQIETRGWQQVSTGIGAETRMLDQQRVGAVPVGITSADAAIAATGSVVLAHGVGRSRSASLYGEHHVVLVPIDRIVDSLADAFDLIGWATSNVVVITGPSRTGDIESILTLGVHGPRHLHIVLIG
jgi:L-lactate dehydrogenase complex protein LldG